MQEDTAILLGINVAVNQHTVDPPSVNFFPTPLMPDTSLIMTPFSDILCLADNIGGKLSDYENPLENERKKIVTQENIKRIHTKDQNSQEVSY